MEQLQTLIQQKFSEKPMIIGLQGLQGVGKTTMGQGLRNLFQTKNIPFESVSIDDFYLSYSDRQKLEKKYYKFRGPPGTHDYQQILGCLQEFKQGKQIKVPIFNKALHDGQGDRVGERIINAKVLLFEGWFVGYRSKEYQQKQWQNLNLFGEEFNEDIGLFFSKELKNYEFIWDLFDLTIQIKPNPLELSLKWRLEAEQKMRITNGSGMTDKQIQDFVVYFWNCLHPQIYIINSDLAIEVNEAREYKVL